MLRFQTIKDPSSLHTTRKVAQKDPILLPYLMYPYTPLYDVNVTSIYNNTRTHYSNIFILDNFTFWSLFGGGEE